MNTLAGEIHVVDILNPIDPWARKRVRKVAYNPELRILDLVQERKAAGEDVLVVDGVNDQIVEDWTRPVLPGDFLYIIPVLHEPISFSITLFSFTIAGATITVGIGLSAAAIAAMAVGLGASLIGGVLMNALAPAPGMPSLKPGESPAYSWNPASNPENDGGAIPVAYGAMWATPTVIGRYIEIDDDGDQWAHVLLCVHEGETNNVPTASEILANDEPLTIYDDYVVKATDGSISPDTTQLDKFRKLHQMRAFNKYIAYRVVNTNIRTLLHLNGTNGSTTITDASSYGYTWSCVGTANLTTTAPKFGSACLDVATAGERISTNDYKALWLFQSATHTWDVECMFKTPNNAQDSGIMAQSFAYNSGDTLVWGFAYVGGNLEFNYWQDPGAGAVTVYFNVSAAWTPTNDTWYHLRVACDGAGTIKIWVDGMLLVTGTQSTAPVAMTSDFLTDQNLIGYSYKDVGGSITTYDGLCYLDEIRIARTQLLYEWVDTFDVPTVETDSGDTPETFRTKGVVDEATLIFECPLGLYYMNEDAELVDQNVKLMVEYQKVGGSDWEEEELTITGNSRYPVRKQLNIPFPERGQYDYRVYRTNQDFQDTKIQSRCYWIALDEILDEFIHYNGLQCVQVSIKAQDSLSGNIPVLRVKVNRSQITIPGLGAVDATVHANVVRDMFTNRYYGPGVALPRFHEDAFDDWEDWTTGLVGGYPRAQFNMIFDTEDSMDKALQFVEESGRGTIVPKGTRISVVVDKPCEPTATYSDGNIITGSQRFTTLPQLEKIDRVEISYPDVSQNGKTVPAPPALASYYNTLTRLPRTAKLFIPSINNEEQATRLGILKIQQSEALKRVCEFQTGRNAIRSKAGDTFFFQHPGNKFTTGGRVKWDVENDTTIYIDQKVTLDSASAATGYQIIIQKSGTDEQVTVDISGPLDTETKTLTLASAVTVSRRDVYMICRKTEEKIAYRATTVSRQFDQKAKKQRFALVGALYTESAYYNASYEGGSVAI